METHLRTELVLTALQMAISQRRPERVIHHSDQGTQYTSIAFGKRCQEASVRPSTGSVGDCYDNAKCESFFATLECELIDRRRFRNQDEAQREVFISSRVGTIHIVVTQELTTNLRTTSNGDTTGLHNHPRQELTTKSGEPQSVKISNLKSQIPNLK